jgi:transposase InsO family protein
MAYTLNPAMPKVRQEAADLVRRGWSTRQVARHLGYSQGAVVQWVKKAKVIGYHPIPTKSSRPKHHPKELEENLVHKIVEKRFELGRSSEVVHKALEEEGISVSISSVKRTLDRRGLLKKRSPWKRLHLSTPRPDVLNTGDLVQVDTIHLLTPYGRIYVFTLIDLYSRWAYARCYDRANTRNAIDFLRRAKIESLFEFKCIQSDHGSEFSQHFTERIKIFHRHSRIRKPNDNAHLERFNRTIQEECLDRLPKDVSTINSELPEYLKYYNEKRYHFGLKLKTPMQIIKEVNTRY